jgi:glutamyl-tRNA(Gln) amidotransferase subunit E
VDLLDRNAIKEVLIRVHKGEFAKEAVPEIFRWLALNKGRSVSEAVSALSLSAVDLDSVRRSVNEIVDKNMDTVRREGERAVSRLMGDLMKLYRGRIDGKVLHDLLSEEVRRALQKG